MPVPVIDVSALDGGDRMAKLAVAREIRSACTDIGFFTVVGHGVPGEVLVHARQAAMDFFHAPEAVKNEVLRPPEKITRGWNPAGDRSLARTLGGEAPPDLQEAFGMGPPDPHARRASDAGLFAPNKWPDVPGFRRAMTAFYGAMTDLANRMMRGFAMALELDEGFFDDKTNRHCSVVRLIRYLPREAEPLPGQMRAGAHTDYGTFTFVRGDNVPGGLQVCEDGRWRDVETPPDGFVCNIGDAMQRWTDGRFRSTLHRVADPPEGAGERISLVYFHQPNPDVALGGIGDAAEAAAPTFAEHYFGKVARAAGKSASAFERLVVER